MKHDLDHNEQELQLLYRGIKRAKGFHLYLAQCDNHRLRAKLLASLKQRLETDGIAVYYLHLKSLIVSLDEFLPAGLTIRGKEKAVLLVSGLENSIIDTVESQAFLHRLNYARDLLPKKIPVPLVLWLPTTIFNKILTEAHDLWSWRSGTFYFSEPMETEMLQLREEMDTLVDKERQGTISEKFYKEQLDYLAYLLEDLDSNADSGTVRLQRADVMQQISELHYTYAKILRHANQRTGCLEKALEYQIKALEIKELIMDKHHPDVAKSYANLSSIYEDMLQLDRALEFQLKAIEINEAVLDKNHPDLAASYNNASSIYRDMGQLDRALEFQLKALTIWEAVLDKNHPDLATSYNNISLIYQDMGQPDRALEFQLKALAIREAALAKNHPDLAMSYNNVAVIYKRMGQLDRALEFQLEALAIQEAVLAKNDPDVAQSYNNLALIYKDMGQLDRALELQLKAFEIEDEVLDKNHPHLAMLYYNLSAIYRDMNDHASALLYAEKAVAIMQKLFPIGHPNLDKAKKNLENIKKKRGNIT